MSAIVLACHGGESAEGAVRIAKKLSARIGSRVEVITVVEPPTPTDYGFGPVFIPDASTEERLEAEALRDAQSQLNRWGLGDHRPKLVIGAPSAAIAEFALERHASLIVVGLGPHHFADRALGGETALQLAQIASTPVLAVPASATELPQRVVTAVDYSLTSLTAARIAASYLQAGDTLELVHVAPDAKQAASGGEGPADLLRELSAGIERPTGVHSKITVLEHEPARALLDYAEREHADLIALGSHGYGIWKRLLVGSVASKVLRLAQCAVLVVPARCVVTPSAERLGNGAGWEGTERVAVE
jgi:nucleotide-binding universal stress UspA family protein